MELFNTRSGMSLELFLHHHGLLLPRILENIKDHVVFFCLKVPKIQIFFDFFHGFLQVLREIFRKKLLFFSPPLPIFSLNPFQRNLPLFPTILSKANECQGPGFYTF